MQQLQATTADQNEQTPLAAYAPPAETSLTPEQVTEANKAEQQQSPSVEKLLATLESDTRKRLKWDNLLSKIAACSFIATIVALPVVWFHTRDVRNWFHYFQLSNFLCPIAYVLGAFFLRYYFKSWQVVPIIVTSLCGVADDVQV